jgi:hypothetical protein
MISMTNQSRQTQIAMVKDVTELQELSQNVNATYDAFMSIQDPDKIDIFTMPGIKLKQCLYDLQDKIDEMTGTLNKITPSPEVA